MTTYTDRTIGPETAQPHNRRRRRPSGAPPPLPRSIGATGVGWLIASGILVVWAIFAMTTEWASRITDQVDSAILRADRARCAPSGSPT